ncbi:SDR family NAD(P)-dependent oxidoreductase [Deinococcus metallilatus]|uniref:NAD(P)-dependent dehydrogenase (Short-subunit alcohol dehydrogenase family) n=2 Tax=Deinococcus metallilatus TaxID=1211322 RepID=A0ABR6MSS5_9DEIO|nr:SDR family oxidoreductase [Deinococcus metallilatus]MBB5294962.1 NAD(P)-dependent dehydrogenase (short-subunit alcohol dehydrogenase family) [Deinococcus metallilatus]
MMLLQDKVAIIYGAGGAVGGAVAQAFTRHGAQVYLTGRTLAAVQATATRLQHTGRVADAACVDATDAAQVQSYLDRIIARTGRLDISFHAVGLEDVQGAPLLEMSLADVARPVERAVKTQFITATSAARQMVQAGSGVILGITAEVPGTNTGGFGIACAATELLFKQLALEVGRHGVRALCLRSSGSPDAPGVDEVFEQHARLRGLTRAAFEAQLGQGLALKRLPKLAEIGDAAVLAASDLASAMTVSSLNVTCGSACP